MQAVCSICGMDSDCPKCEGWVKVSDGEWVCDICQDGEVEEKEKDE